MWKREGPAALERMLETSATGRGAGLFVAGEPGSGKSALLNAARIRSANTFRVGWGQADAVEATVPFGIFSQVFRRISSPELREPTESMLAALKTSRVEAFRIALHYVEAASASQPTLIILDDLHCADAESLALLAYLSRRVGSMAVGILGSFRLWPAAAIDIASRLPGGEQAILRMPRMDAGRVEALLQARIGRVPSLDEVAAMFDQCQGNPHLVHQLLVHQRGPLPVDGRLDGWRRSDLRELISRFVGESQELRMVAAAASIFGDYFRPALAVRAA